MGETNEFLKYVGDKAGKPFQFTDILSISFVNALMGIVTGKRFKYTDKKIIHCVHIMKTISSNPSLSGPVNFFLLLAKLPFGPLGVENLLKLSEEIYAYWRSVIQEHKDELNEKNMTNLIAIYLHEMAPTGTSGQFGGS